MMILRLSGRITGLGCSRIVATHYRLIRGFSAPPELEDKNDREEYRRIIRKSYEEGSVSDPAAVPRSRKAYEGGVNPETGEVNGPVGLDPVRYGDWQYDGHTSDF